MTTSGSDADIAEVLENERGSGPSYVIACPNRVASVDSATCRGRAWQVQGRNGLDRCFLIVGMVAHVWARVFHHIAVGVAAGSLALSVARY